MNHDLIIINSRGQIKEKSLKLYSSVTIKINGIELHEQRNIQFK